MHLRLYKVILVNIIVCMKQVPGSTRVQIDEKTGVLLRSSADAKTNPFDLYALETAVRLKEQHGATIKVFSMGPPQSARVLREAYALGADQGFLISDPRIAGSDCLATAYTLSNAILAAGLPDLILCGKQTTDGDTAQVGPEIAEMLGIPHASNVLAILAVAGDGATVKIDLGDQIQTAILPFPCLLTVEKDIEQPRLPSYRRMLETRSRPVTTWTLDDLPDCEPARCGLSGSPTRVIRVFQPQAETQNVLWTGPASEQAASLADLLVEKKFI